MTETARLVIAVDSSGAKRATDNLDKLDRAAGKSERAANKLGKAWGVAIGLVSSAVIIGATRAFIRQADAMANMSAKLKLVTGDTKAATAAQRDLFDLSQRTSSDLEATTELYVKLGQSSKELATNHALLLGITEKVSKALVISGADAASSAAVIRQFSQAMAAGALRGDEFISVMEGAPRLAQAIADGMGVAVGSLRNLAAEGKLTSEAIIKALEDQGAVLDREFGEMPLTVSRATQQVRNALTQLIGDTDKTSGATKGLAEAIADLARKLESQEVKDGFATMVTGLVNVASFAANAAAEFANFAKWVGEAAARAQGFTAADDVAGVQERLSKVNDALETRRSGGGRWAGVARTFTKWWDPLEAQEQARLAAMSTAELEAERRKLLEFQRMQQRAAALAAGRKRPLIITGDSGQIPDSAFRPAAGGSSGSSSGGSGGATARATAQRALNQEVEKTLTLEDEWAILEAEVYGPAAIEAHNRKVEAWAREGEAVEQATDKMSLFAEQAARNMQDAFADFLFNPFENGVKGMLQSFGEALQRMAAQVATSRLFEALGSWASGYTGTGSSWINALGAAFGGGRAGEGPVMAGQSYWVGEKGRELFTPATNGTVSNGGGNVTVKPEIHFNVRNESSAKVSQPEVRMDGAKILIDMVVSEVDKRIATMGSTGKAVGGRFGLQPVGVTRG